MKAAFYTLGCKVNQYETQLMEQRLADAGFEIVAPDETADVYVINTCTVTAESDRKTRQMLHRFKEHSPGAVAVLAGCFPQSAPERAQALPEADVIAGTRERANIVELVQNALRSGGRLVRVAPYSEAEPDDASPARGRMGHTRAYVKIEDGCRSFCTYCIVPAARGPIRSKPAKAVRAETQGLLEAGYREVVLVGVNLASYGADTGESLADAVRAACSTGIARIRLGSLEPNVVTPRFLERAAPLQNLCPHFHLSLQSGCEATLRRMNRRYTPEAYLAAVDALRAAFPGCAVTTDIIVGFPGETEEEFARSAAFAREAGFARVHVFPYSRREGTPAASMPGQLTGREKRARVHRMMEACEPARLAFLRAHVGRELPVLFERDAGGSEGLTADYARVRVAGAENRAGELLPVRVTGCSEADDTLLGELAPRISG